MENGKFQCFRLESTNATGEIVPIDKHGDSRLTFHSVQISEAIRVGVDPTDNGTWERGVAEPWPPRERAKFALSRTIHFLYGLGWRWACATGTLAWLWERGLFCHLTRVFA
jgi:hypothetical protein